MKEKLLAALKTKFQGVQEAILDRQAEKLAKTVTTEDQIDTAVSGVTFDTLLQSETDRRTTEASETAVKNYEKKHKIKDGKAIEDPKKKTDPDPKKKGEEGDDEKVPAWAKTFMEKQDALDERLSKQEKERETSNKLSQAKELLKGSKIPEKYQDKWLKRIDVNDEDTSLEDQVKNLETEFLDLKQEFVNDSVDEGAGEKGSEATDNDMDAYLDDKFPEGAKETKS